MYQIPKINGYSIPNSWFPTRAIADRKIQPTLFPTASWRIPNTPLVIRNSFHQCKWREGISVSLSRRMNRYSFKQWKKIILLFEMNEQLSACTLQRIGCFGFPKEYQRLFFWYEKKYLFWKHSTYTI